jgi:hypothetical protein
VWLDDVVSHTTIHSVWGNGVRNQLVQIFDTTAERDSRTAVLPNGSECWVLANSAHYVKLGGAWQRTNPLRLAVAGTGGVMDDMFAVVATIHTPDGFSRAQLSYSVFMDGTEFTDTQTATVAMWTGAGATQVGNSRQDIASAGVTQFHMALDVPINPAGDTITVGLGSTDTSGTIWYWVYSDPSNHQLMATLWPS